MKFENCTKIFLLALIGGCSVITSAFTANHHKKLPSLIANRRHRSKTQLGYEPSPDNDARRAKGAKDALDSGFWNAISYTEQWISEVLKETSTKGKSNPYARKELIYVCEMNNMALAAVAGIFR